jgi:hypothetical protein
MMENATPMEENVKPDKNKKGQRISKAKKTANSIKKSKDAA